jgi:RNA polymerase sigma factor (sigma-70 family)
MNKPDLEKEKFLFDKVKESKKNFDEIYKYFLNDVYRFSYSLLNNRHDAEDIASQTFITFYNKFDSLEWQGISLKYWLFTTARNLCLKKFNKPQNETLDENYHVNEETEISFVDQIINLELVEQVKSEIQSLNPIEQEVINLRIWEGMQFNEIAKIQHASEDTTKKRFYRSIEKIKKSLESKNIRSLIAFSILFTAIKQVSTVHAYSAPLALSEASFISGKFIKNNMVMDPTKNTIKTFLTSKAGITTILLFTITFATVAGVFWYKSNNKASSDDKVTNVTPIPTQSLTDTVGPTSTNVVTPTTDPKANWKTYSDNKNNFEFKYPSTLVIKSGVMNGFDSLEFYPEQNNTVTPEFIFYVEENTQGFDEYISANCAFFKTCKSAKDLTNLTVGGYSAVRGFITDLNYLAEDVVWKKDNLFFRFQRSKNEGQSSFNTEIFENILSSFKFLTPTSETYTDNDVKLAFDYPSNFTVKAGKFTTSTEGRSNKLIEVILNANTKLEITYADSNYDCVSDPGQSVVDILFKNTYSNINISRRKVSSQQINYSSYSSDKNGQGYPCDPISFDNEIPKPGYFYVRIKINNTNQDFTDFDNIVKSIRRL